MNTTKVTLWLISETTKARHYSRLPPERNPEESDKLWVPLSVIEHTSKEPSGRHIVTLSDWFAERAGL